VAPGPVVSGYFVEAITLRDANLWPWPARWPPFGWPLGPLHLRPFCLGLSHESLAIGGACLFKGMLGPVTCALFRGCAVLACLSFLHMLLDGASLAVIRSGQGDAWGCGGSWWLWTPFRVSSGCWGRRSPIGPRLVLVGSVGCWLMAIIAARLLGVSRGWHPPLGVVGRWCPPPWGPMLWTLGLARWPLCCEAEGPLGNSVGAEGRRVGYPL
jgi:hypothetical protein